MCGVALVVIAILTSYSRGEFLLKLSLSRSRDDHIWLMCPCSSFSSCTRNFISCFISLHINTWVFMCRWSEAIKLSPACQLGFIWQATLCLLCANPGMVKGQSLGHLSKTHPCRTEITYTFSGLSIIWIYYIEKIDEGGLLNILQRLSNYLLSSLSLR